jgi:hypothetical protein
MITIKEKIENLESILRSQEISLEDKQILLKELARLKQELKQYS